MHMVLDFIYGRGQDVESINSAEYVVCSNNKYESSTGKLRVVAWASRECPLVRFCTLWFYSFKLLQPLHCRIHKDIAIGTSDKQDRLNPRRHMLV